MVLAWALIFPVPALPWGTVAHPASARQNTEMAIMAMSFRRFIFDKTGRNWRNRPARRGERSWRVARLKQIWVYLDRHQPRESRRVDCKSIVLADFYQLPPVPHESTGRNSAPVADSFNGICHKPRIRRQRCFDYYNLLNKLRLNPNVKRRFHV